ncbi:mRNA-decapping enzyme subunit 2 [Linnemannia hyalina]|uniref:mRNA-decapping enzyme subunit 2 n=1 Tax=Linnemannia hyalina TaxID=64524 RepID=A0A9P8BVQ0_9FUNG|nr:mRNA-decapping enzyme subunit 2 [Linnemannia hyalina]
MAWTNATFDHVLDDLSSRFIINVPDEELASVERICFQIEQAHWFYEDFIREQNSALPSFNLKSFSAKFFQHCPLLHEWANEHETAFANFMEYKIRVPVCGAIILNDAMDKCILVKGWTARSGWGFPKGKINKDEPDASCAVREVWEETGFDASEKIRDEDFVEQTIKDQRIRLYIIKSVSENTVFEPQTRKEISKIEWHYIADLPTSKPKPIEKGTHSGRESGTERSNGIKNPSRYYMVTPFVHKLKNWIITQRRSNKRSNSKGQHNQLAHLQSQGNDSSTSTGSHQQQHSSNRHQAGVPTVSSSEARLDSDVLKNMLGIGKPVAFSQESTPVHYQQGQHPAHQSPPLSRGARDSSESLKALLGIQGGVSMLNADGTATGSPVIQSSTTYSSHPVSMPSSATSNSSASVPFQNGSDALKAMLGIPTQSNSPLLHPSHLATQHGGSPLMANAGVAMANGNNNGNRGSYGSNYSPQPQHASAASSPMRARNGPVDLLALLKGGGGGGGGADGLQNGNVYYDNGMHHAGTGNGVGSINNNNGVAPGPGHIAVTKPKTMQNFTFDMEALF